MKGNDDLLPWVQNLWGKEPIPDEMQPAIKRLITPQIVERELMALIHEWLDFQRLSKQPGRIVAPPRTGKSISCDVYKLLNKPHRANGRQRVIPVLYLQVPGNCSPGELLTLILEQLNYGASTGTTTALRQRVLRVLKEYKVEMLIIDEANFLKLNTFSEIARIYDLVRLSIILVGTDELDSLIKRNEYVHDRFIECYRFGILSRQEFRDLVQVWEEEIIQLPVPSNLTQEQTLMKLYEKTGGKIGLLDRVMRKAGLLALKQGAKKIDKEILNEVLGRFE
ncbi:TniB family NTP-binding protein [Laspinema sp. A4]|uniref:TniB family NTP-binding protein n=1 Tax=Laspinema sp. D2d TaxID=2953686 RepID=UPI0021BB17A9|nr:TniB family NTP-binding protein [Laspinema sp. D2d]MCT7984517.1 TniB family NTP-binding protein [Laspinema sp. D2d]